MEKQNHRISILSAVLFCTLFSFSARSQENQKIIYNAFISGDMQRWKEVIITLEKKESNGLADLLELVNYYYGYTGWLIKAEEEKTAEEYIAKAHKLLDRILKFFPENSSALAYKGAFIGFELGMHPYKAMVLGPKSLNYIDKALEMGPDNFQTHLEKGNASYYTPSVFGGSKSDAIKSYNKAIELMEKQGNTTEQWMYLSALTTLAQAYQKTNQLTKAGETYQKILQIEPNFQWVKNELYPEYLKIIQD